MLVVTTEQVERLFARPETVPRNTKSAISKQKYRYFPPSSTQNYSSYYMPHNKHPSPLLVGDFRDEEKQNQLGVEKINSEVNEIENDIKSLAMKERELKNTKAEIINQQGKLKEDHSQVLMLITKVRAEIRDDSEDTKTIEEMIR